MIKAVMIDLGNVITSYKTNDYFHHLAKVSGVPYEKLSKMLDNDGIRSETGKIGIKEFDKIAARKLKLSKRQSDWMSYYRKHSDIDRQLVNYAKLLRKKYKVACISNISDDTFYYTQKKIGTKIFDYYFLSFQMGVMKPSKIIYRKALKRMKTKANETVLIDDSSANVKSAKQMGIVAIQYHYKNLRSLKEKMAKITD